LGVELEEVGAESCRLDRIMAGGSVGGGDQVGTMHGSSRIPLPTSPASGGHPGPIRSPTTAPHTAATQHHLSPAHQPQMDQHAGPVSPISRIPKLAGSSTISPTATTALRNTANGGAGGDSPSKKRRGQESQYPAPNTPVTSPNHNQTAPFSVISPSRIPTIHNKKSSLDSSSHLYQGSAGGLSERPRKNSLDNELSSGVLQSKIPTPVRVSSKENLEDSEFGHRGLPQDGFSTNQPSGDITVNRRKTSNMQPRARPQSIDIEDEFNHKIDRQRQQAIRIEQAMAVKESAARSASQGTRQSRGDSHSPPRKLSVGSSTSRIPVSTEYLQKSGSKTSLLSHDSSSCRRKAAAPATAGKPAQPRPALPGATAQPSGAAPRQGLPQPQPLRNISF